jgi:hypothetical protein
MIHHFILYGVIPQTKHLLNYPCVIIIGEKSTPTINWRELSTADKRHLKYIYLKKIFQSFGVPSGFKSQGNFEAHAW